MLLNSREILLPTADSEPEATGLCRRGRLAAVGGVLGDILAPS